MMDLGFLNRREEKPVSPEIQRYLQNQLYQQYQQYYPQQTVLPAVPQQFPPIVEWLLANPSIPTSLRNRFYQLWEIVIFGNYDEKDIAFLMSKFREWCILMLWYIPEQEWPNRKVFAEPDGSLEIDFDLNLLLNTLEQIYYINLTRGKEGFTVKELGTQRFIQRSELPEMPQPKKVSLF